MWIQTHKRKIVLFWILVLIIDVILVLLQAGGAILSFAKRTGSDTSSSAISHTSHNTSGAAGQVLASVPEPFRTIIYQLDLNYEGNFATWFNAFNFLLAGIGAFIVIYYLDKGKVILRLFWIAMALALIFLAVEEIISAHSLISSKYDSSKQFILGPFTWTKGVASFIFYIVPLSFGAIVFIVLSLLTFKEFRFVRNISLIGILCWLVSFIVEELVHFLPYYLRRTEMFIEESLELAGALLLCFGFIEYGLIKTENSVNRDGGV